MFINKLTLQDLEKHGITENTIYSTVYYKCFKDASEKSINEGYKANDWYTHGSVFHADDVFSTAFLLIVREEFGIKDPVEIHRVFKIDEGQFAYDIGEGEFDHHQKNQYVFITAEAVDQAVSIHKACAFTLLLSEYADSIEAGLFEAIYKKYGRGIEDADNGIEYNLLSGAIADMNPTWDSGETSDKGFREAVDMAKKLLTSYISRFRSKKKAEDVVASAKRSFDGKVLNLDMYCPWQNYIEDEILYVVFPSNRNPEDMNIQAAPISPESFICKTPFPEEWRGKSVEELPDGINFCHPSGFLCSVKKDKVEDILSTLSFEQENFKE